MSENRTIYEQIGLPKTINIKEYTYVFKKDLKNYFVSFANITFLNNILIIYSF